MKLEAPMSSGRWGVHTSVIGRGKELRERWGDGERKRAIGRKFCQNPMWSLRRRSLQVTVRSGDRRRSPALAFLQARPTLWCPSGCPPDLTFREQIWAFTNYSLDINSFLPARSTFSKRSSRRSCSHLAKVNEASRTAFHLIQLLREAHCHSCAFSANDTSISCGRLRHRFRLLRWEQNKTGSINKMSDNQVVQSVGLSNTTTASLLKSRFSVGGEGL